MDEKVATGYNRMQEAPMDQPPQPVMAQPGYGQPQPGYPPQQGYPPPAGGYPPQQGYAPQTTHTTVVVQQPAVVVQGQRDWSTGMCGCFEDIGSCCLGYFCPCFLLIDVSQRLGEGCCFPCCCPGALVGLRVKLRVEQNISGSLMNDYCAVQCLPLCVLCQLSRELKHLGR